MRHNPLYFVAVLIFVLGFAFGGVIFAQRPANDINPTRWPNLAEAQHHISQAFDKIDEAQKDNKFKLGDHAEKAKDLLAQASRELKAAADYVEHHH